MKTIKKDSNTPLTVDALRKSVAKSQLSRLRLRSLAYVGRFKRFYHAFKLPTIATGIFILVILSLAVVRQLEQTSLLALINNVNETGNGYTTLLSADEADIFTRGDTTEDSSPNNTTNQTVANSTQSNSTSFSLDSGDQTQTPTTNTAPPNSNSGGGANDESPDDSGNPSNPGDTPTTPPQPPFTSEVESFSRTSTNLQCSNSAKRNKGTCSKVYSFGANIKTVNGPGSVNYAWQSNISSGNGSGTYSVGSGSAITAVTKQVTLSCNKDVNFNIQLSVLSPNTSSSNTINVNHNCNEL